MQGHADEANWSQYLLLNIIAVLINVIIFRVCES